MEIDRFLKMEGGTLLMPRTITFTHAGQSYPLELVKLDRDKLYGWSEIEARDADGGLCTLMNYYPGTGTLLPSGTITMGALTPEGHWADRSDLKAVDPQGNEAPLVESSFKTPVGLEATVPITTFLEHRITAVYTLQGESGVSELVQAVADSAEIFTFPFNYRTDYEAAPGFLMENGGELFVLVGQKMEFSFIGFDQPEPIVEAADTDVAELDFSMF